MLLSLAAMTAEIEEEWLGVNKKYLVFVKSKPNHT